MNFENPRYLYLLFVIPLYLIIKYTKLGRGILNSSSFPFPYLKLLSNTKIDKLALSILIIKELTMLLLITSLIITLARPRGGSAITTENNLGVDIMLITDISGSMTFIDEPPADARRVSYLGQERFIDTDGDLKKQTRLEVAKRVMQNYIEKQNFNRIGLVLFSSYALTKAPLSSDKSLLKQIVGEINYFEEGATAIGTGILTALNRIRHSKAKSKVLILLTDGINNAGIVEPITAANVARELGVKIYTIGIGDRAGSLRPIDMSLTTYIYESGGEFDPKTLQEIANITGGKFFEAVNENSLQEVYNEIDSLEKSEITVKRRVLYEEKFNFWLKLASFFMALWLLLNTLFIRIP